jgi:predicted ribosome quality control (RQC) complex YloA/Tae2 family protein
MKTEISSLELNRLVRELQGLLGGKLEQLYQVGRDEFILQLHVPGTGKSILRIIIGKIMYVASSKGSAPDKPPSFCVYLRKKLKNARLKSISQLGFERIVELVFETKDARFRLVFELFSKGNVMLCDEQGVILSALEQQEWKDRVLKPKQRYDYPKKEFSFLALTKSELELLLRKSDRESLVKTLAMELGLGGVYAEEICLLSKVDKNVKSNTLSGQEVASLYAVMQDLLSRQSSPVVVYEDDARSKVRDITPFRLEFYREFAIAEFDDFSDALDSVLTTKQEAKEIDAVEKHAKTRIDKIDEMIAQQRLRIEGLEVSEKENRRKAELVYENYILIQQVLAEVNELRKSSSWHDIKERFKGHKLIKEINEKTGEITLEI